jgi:hypothetical protein
MSLFRLRFVFKHFQHFLCFGGVFAIGKALEKGSITRDVIFAFIFCARVIDTAMRRIPELSVPPSIFCFGTIRRN